MQIVKLILCLVLPLVVGGLSGIATAEGVSGWYQTVLKPPFNPPNYLFGPVWTVLYLLMGVSLFLLLNQPAGAWKTRALIFFGIQISLNFLWSFLFFKFHVLGIALAEIIVLWLMIAAMIFTMIQVKPVIGLIQIPYLLWVSFATVLNASFWWLNR